jgi:hypothetical protein
VYFVCPVTFSMASICGNLLPMTVYSPILVLFFF